jgi:hypothetical protein
MSETKLARNNISTIEERRLTERPRGRSHTTRNSLERAARLKIEEAGAKHRRQEASVEASHRRWKERLYTQSGVGLALAVILLCAAVLLLNYSAEDKKWASAILTHGAAALTTYLGVKAKSKDASDDN